MLIKLQKGRGGAYYNIKDVQKNGSYNRASHGAEQF